MGGRGGFFPCSSNPSSNGHLADECGPDPKELPAHSPSLGKCTHPLGTEGSRAGVAKGWKKRQRDKRKWSREQSCGGEGCTKCPLLPVPLSRCEHPLSKLHSQHYPLPFSLLAPVCNLTPLGMGLNQDRTPWPGGEDDELGDQVRIIALLYQQLPASLGPPQLPVLSGKGNHNPYLPVAWR